MSPRRETDEQDENWQYKRASDIERLFRLAIGIIGLLILAVCSFAWATVLEVKQISLDNQTIAIGQARENQSQDSSIAFLRRDIQDHISKHVVVWTVEEKKYYEALREELYRRWGFISITRSGEEVLLKQPMKENLP